MKKFKFNVCDEFRVGIARLSSVIGFEIGDGLTVSAEACDKIGVKISGNEATIYYIKPHHFFRQLGILASHSEDGSFEAYDDTHFEDVSVMLDVSYGAPQNVKTLCQMLDYLALMGYSAAMLYTEDVIELETRPFFGYMQGKYTADELRTLDDYANDYGIELLPCIECYGHMQKYLAWDESESIRDTAGVLLAREEETFKFLDELIGKLSSCLRSRRINIGMDEAWDMGRGKFLDKHGYVKPIDIFNEYMERLSEILAKYDYRPMMWCDMYFRANSKNGTDYYKEYINVSEETAAAIPENMTLVFWHYGEEPGCDGYMLDKLNALKRPIIYAGGLWDWQGFFPENNYAISSSRESLAACREKNVRGAMMTAWYGRELIFFSDLLGLSSFAELCYDKDADDDKLRRRFEEVTGGDYDSFFKMSAFHNDFDSGVSYPDFNDRFLGLTLFWQDILAGVYDSHLLERPMSGHYAAYAQMMKDAPSDKWSYIYDAAYKVFDYLALKCLIAENLQPAYKRGDREMLSDIAERLLPLLREKTVELKNTQRAIFLRESKMFGWAQMDVRYGGVICRAETAELLIREYLAGNEDALIELSEPRLHTKLTGFNNYPRIAFPSTK